MNAVQTLPAATERLTTTIGTTMAIGTGSSPRRTPLAPLAQAPAPAPQPSSHEARLSQRFAEFVDSGRSVQRYLIRRPTRVLEMLHDIRTLPKIDATLPAGPESEAVRGLLMRHPGSRRATSGVSAVLLVPTAPGAYLIGHERATVRRKVRSALKRGVSVREVPMHERAELLALADRHELLNERAEYRTDAPENGDLLEYGLWVAAYDRAGTPIALSVTPIAGAWAALRYFRTLQWGDASSDARYLMTDAVAEALRTRGVRYLVDTARPHWLPNGVRHFQRMVGFRLMRVGRARVAG